MEITSDLYFEKFKKIFLYKPVQYVYDFDFTFGPLREM